MHLTLFYAINAEVVTGNLKKVINSYGAVLNEMIQPVVVTVSLPDE